MPENLELQTPWQTGELLLESQDPKCSHVVKPIEGNFTKTIIAGFSFSAEIITFMSGSHEVSYIPLLYTIHTSLAKSFSGFSFNTDF